MLALALWKRSRPSLFAWCFLLVILLPVAFIAHYAASFLYLPMVGWSLYAALLLVMVRRLLASRLLRLARARGIQAERLQIASVVALPILLAAFLAPPRHRRESVKMLSTFESEQPPSRQLAEELIVLRLSLPHGARVLFVGDSFAKDEYFLVFLKRLLYRDMSITVERAPLGQGSRMRGDHYDAVFTFQHGRFVRATGPRDATACRTKVPPCRRRER